MKKTIIFVVALTMFGTLQAQVNNIGRSGFSQGDMFVSGAVGYSSTSYPDNSEESSFEFSPRFGYFLNDFVAVGARLGYVTRRAENATGQETADNSTFTIGAFGRYYLLPGSKFSPFGELGVGFGTTRDIYDDWTNGVNAWLAPGISYFVGRHFALEASFGILSYHTVDSDGVSGSTDNFQVGIDLENINFGIIYKF